MGFGSRPLVTDGDMRIVENLHHSGSAGVGDPNGGVGVVE